MTTIGLIGTGKTGSKVFDVASSDDVVVGFDAQNPPTVEKLSKCDVIIAFVDGAVMHSYIDMLIEAKVPVASGSTGMEWPDELDRRLKDAGLAWVTAHNFAIGMNLARNMIETLGKADKLFRSPQFAIHEVHHTKKLDAPSGTALSWQEWLGSAAEISSERTGDVVGEHTVTLETPYESISLHHSAKDRSIFAAGAVWTAEKLVAGTVEPGLHKLEYITKKELGL